MLTGPLPRIVRLQSRKGDFCALSSGFSSIAHTHVHHTPAHTHMPHVCAHTCICSTHVCAHAAHGPHICVHTPHLCMHTCTAHLCAHAPHTCAHHTHHTSVYPHVCTPGPFVDQVPAGPCTGRNHLDALFHQELVDVAVSFLLYNCSFLVFSLLIYI